MSTTTALKNLAYIPAFILAPTGVSTEAVFILFSIMMFDMVTGIIKSTIIYGPQEVTTNLAIAGLFKKLTLLGVPVMLAWGGEAIGINFIFLVKGTFSILVLYEIYSNIGNIISARKGKEVREYDALSELLTIIYSHLEKIIRSHTPKK